MRISDWSSDVCSSDRPPAIPMVRQPISLAIWPAAEPTRPAAVETTTVFPATGSPALVSARRAVMPLMPSRPSESDSGEDRGEQLVFIGTRLAGTQVGERRKKAGFLQIGRAHV